MGSRGISRCVASSGRDSRYEGGAATGMDSALAVAGRLSRWNMDFWDL